jgi:two-component system invasion response regulator UvrY
MIDILIADDHPLILSGVKQILSETDDIRIVDEASDGIDAFEKLRTGKYDVGVLDYSMPGMNGIEILKALKTHELKIPILIISTYPEEQYAVRVLKAGAYGYLTKIQAPAELVKAIRLVANGEMYIASAVTKSIIAGFSNNKKDIHHKHLSDREFQVFRMIAEGKAVKEIANTLSISDKTVSTYRARVMDKMGMTCNAQLTQYAIKNDLLDNG